MTMNEYIKKHKHNLHKQRLFDINPAFCIFFFQEIYIKTGKKSVMNICCLMLQKHKNIHIFCIL